MDKSGRIFVGYPRLHTHLHIAVCSKTTDWSSSVLALTSPPPINTKLALTIYKPLIRSSLTYAAPAWGHAVNTHFNILQNFQNKLLRMTTKFPRVTLIDTLYERTGTECVSSYVTRTAKKLYFTNQFSDKEQIRQLGQFNTTHDKHTSHPVGRPTSL